MAVNYTAGEGPQAVVAADFNNDLIQDLAVANSGSNSVSVLLGNSDVLGKADGTFMPAIEAPTGNSPLSIAVGDFDADGYLDLATANAGDVSVLLGDGQGAFGAPNKISIGSNPASVAVGDFNGDGNLDLGVTSNVQLPGSYYYGYYGGTYYSPGPLVGYANVLVGNGGGSFSPPLTTDLGYGNHTSAAAADFNGDGKDDFATLNVDYGMASVLLGTSSGALSGPAGYLTGWYPQAVTVGDFTGDDILDLATAGQTIDILPGLGNGAFRPVVRQYIDPVAVAAADFNSDGMLDLVAADPYAGTVSALLGLGTGALTLPLNHTAGAWPVAVAVGDFNSDGRPDVAAANATSGDVSVLLNNGVWPAANAPSLRIGDASVAEGNTGAVSANFNVTLTAASSQTVTVQYDTVSGSASTDDFQAAVGTVTFAPGQTSQTVTVLVNGDRLGEYGEYFSVRLSNPVNAFVIDAWGSGAILDDEPRASIGSATVVEGNTGQKSLNFAVTLAAPYDAPVTVTYATADGSATLAGGDYQAATGSVTFAPGQTSQPVTVLVNGDRTFEYDESLSVNLTGATGAIISNAWGYGTIQDDEPRLSINSVSLREGPKNTRLMTFTVSLAAAYDQAVTVNYATHNSSAIAGEDYVATSGSLTFAAGQTTKTFTVAIKGDRKREWDESFYVLLSGASSNALIANAYGWGTIQDDDR